MTFATAAPVTLFAGLMLFVSLQLLAASGHFPLQARTAAMKSGTSVIVLWVSIALTLAALATGAVAAARSGPWQGLVIGGGLAVLAAPLLLQPCPDWFVDGRAALLSFAAGAVICAALNVLMASG
jgi:hypothetical protein